MLASDTSDTEMLWKVIIQWSKFFYFHFVVCCDSAHLLMYTLPSYLCILLFLSLVCLPTQISIPNKAHTIAKQHLEFPWNDCKHEAH